MRASFFLTRTKRHLIVTAAVIYVLMAAFSLLSNRSGIHYTMPLMYADPAFTENTGSGKCKVDWDQFGEVEMDMMEDPPLSDIEAENTDVEAGGKWKPKTCSAWQQTAVIVPYRDRWHHFKLLMKRLHPMLQRQKLNYHIFLVEQVGNDTFNRAMLMNVGVLEALKLADFNCFIFHDVDLLPENDQNLYYCDNQLRHLSCAIDEMRYHVLYYNYMGGVAAVNKENLFKMNGFSNQYWGWGGEDDDFSARRFEAGLELSRPPDYIGKYKMARHVKGHFQHNQYGLFLSWRARMKLDGLNSVASGYRLLKVETFKLYTRFLVDVGKAPVEPIMHDLPTESYFWFLWFFFP